MIEHAMKAQPFGVWPYFAAAFFADGLFAAVTVFFGFAAFFGFFGRLFPFELFETRVCARATQAFSRFESTESFSGKSTQCDMAFPPGAQGRAPDKAIASWKASSSGSLTPMSPSFQTIAKDRPTNEERIAAKHLFVPEIGQRSRSALEIREQLELVEHGPDHGSHDLAWPA